MTLLRLGRVRLRPLPDGNVVPGRVQPELCKSMQVVVWDGSKPPVRRCDGQLLPVAHEQRVSAA
jgi:hypothetical protein